MSIGEFLSKKNVIAVVGATVNKEKFGYKVFMALRKMGFKVYPVNPKYSEIEGTPCYPSIGDLPEKPDVVITVVPPRVTEEVVRKCAELGIDKVWMQPGSESEKAIEFCEEKGIKVVHGTCFIVDGLSASFDELLLMPQDRE